MKMSKEKVLFSLEKDKEWAATHNVLDYELPSGVHKLPYVTFGGDALIGHYRQLVDLETNEFITEDRVYFDYTDMTYNILPHSSE